jgi:hypothetical protein
MRLVCRYQARAALPSLGVVIYQAPHRVPDPSTDSIQSAMEAVSEAFIATLSSLENFSRIGQLLAANLTVSVHRFIELQGWN